MLEIYPEVTEKDKVVVAHVKEILSRNIISTCELTIEDDEWIIYSWQTQEEYIHQGYGKKCLYQLMRFCFYRYGLPNKIKYIWNGQNDYVKEWLEKHFNVKLISVSKSNKNDNGDIYVYELDIDQLLLYLKIVLIKKEDNRWYLLN